MKKSRQYSKKVKMDVIKWKLHVCDEIHVLDVTEKHVLILIIVVDT